MLSKRKEKDRKMASGPGRTRRHLPQGTEGGRTGAGAYLPNAAAPEMPGPPLLPLME